jgi:predicted nucleotidyltransferase
MVFNPDFKEFIVSLNDNSVDYLIVGGYALAVHGIPRYTQDIDFWIQTTPSNIKKVIKALEDFGFASINLQESDFQDSENVIQLGYPPNRIDLLSAIDGVKFKEAFQKKMVIDLDGISVNFISFQDLMKNKKASGRLQDLADLENLEKIDKKRQK